MNFTRNGLRLGSRHQEPPHTDVSRNLATVVVRGVLPGLRRRRTGLLPSGPKSSFQMRASFLFHLETKVLESRGRVEKLIASSDEMLNQCSGSLWSLKIPGCPSKKSRGVTPASWIKMPSRGQISSLTSDHHGLLIIHIHRLASSLCLLSTNKLVCDGRSGAIWLPWHPLGGCCTLVVVEEIPPFYVKRLEYPEKRYINVTNYYYYYYYSPSCLKSSVKFPQSVMIWSAMSSAGVDPLCFLKTNVTAPVYQEIMEHYMLPSDDQLL